jgi:hypothetical protein
VKQIFICGDELDQTTNVPDYLPSDGWTLYYRLVPRVSGTAILLTGVATVDDKHRHLETSAATANWTAGEYSCFAWVAHTSGAMYTVDPETGARGDTSIVVTLQADPRTVAAFDGRSHARKVLAQIETALEGWAASGSHVAEYEIAGRRMKYGDRADVLAMRSRYKAEVWREDAATAMAAGLPNPRNVMVRFGRA